MNATSASPAGIDLQHSDFGISPPEQPFPTFFERVSGTLATSLRVALPVLVLLSLNISQAGYGDSKLYASEQIQTVFWAFVAALSYFIVLAAIINLFLSAPSRVRLWAIIFLYVTTEVVRTTVVYFVGDSLGLGSEATWGVRIPAAASTGLIFFGALSAIINDASIYRGLYRDLFEQRVRLETMVQSAEETLEQTHSLLRRRVRDELEAALSSTQSELNSSAPRMSVVVDRLFEVVDDVVRPASHSLFTQPQLLLHPQLALQAPRIPLRELIAVSTLTAPFRPVAMFGIFLALFIPVAFALPNSDFAVPLLIATLSLYVASALAKKFIAPQFFRWRLSARVISVSLIYSVPSGILIYLATVAYGAMASPWVTMIYGLILGLALGWILAILAGLLQARSNLLRDVALVNDDLYWNATRLQAQVWADQKSLALALHSDVQGTLLAAALKVRQALLRDTADTSEIAKLADTLPDVQRMITVALDVEAHEADASSLTEIVHRLNLTWGSLVEMRLSVTEHVLERVNSDAITLRVLDDLLTEFQTNSVKHGGAKLSEVVLTLPQRNVLKVILRNDGSREPAKPSATGLGNQFLQSVTLKYQIQTKPVFQVTMQLPLAV